MDIPQQPEPDAKQKDVLENKDLAALGYVWVLSIVVLLSRRESPFIQFHARQGAVLFGLSLVAWALPFVGKLLEILILVCCAYGFLSAAQGQWREIPIVGPLARGSMTDLRASWKDVVHGFVSLWHRLRGTGKATPKSAESSPPTTPPAPVVPKQLPENPTPPPTTLP